MIKNKIFQSNIRINSVTLVSFSKFQHFAKIASALALPYFGSTVPRNFASTSASVIGLPAWPRGNSTNFFFSSRRRHTRLTCDWSSDVCSSDLGAVAGPPPPPKTPKKSEDSSVAKEAKVEEVKPNFNVPAYTRLTTILSDPKAPIAYMRNRLESGPERKQIGRASCRERVENTED